MAFIIPDEIFWASKYPWESLLYLIGVLAWILSGKLIVLEFEKEYSQELYTHKLFCPMTFIMSLASVLFAEYVILKY